MQLLFRTPPNMLQHYLQDTMPILKFQLQMKNLNFSKLTILTVYYIMLLIHTILKYLNQFHKPILLYTMMILHLLLLLLLSFHNIKCIWQILLYPIKLHLYTTSNLLLTLLKNAFSFLYYILRKFEVYQRISLPIFWPYRHWVHYTLQYVT